MTFGEMNGKLVSLVKERVHNGELTESHLARLTGVSQPHIHNVLKGVRLLSTELADEILRQLRINAADLFGRHDPAPFCAVPMLAGFLGPDMSDFVPHRVQGNAFVPAQIAEQAASPLAARLSFDPGCFPRFQSGDTVLIDQGESARVTIVRDGTYVVMTPSGPRLRYIRLGDSRLYLPAEDSVASPARWESVLLDGSSLLRLVRGRVVWISRQLPGELVC